MGSNRDPRTAIAVLVCALALTGCSRYDDVVAENGLDVRAVFLTRTDPPPSYEGHPESFDRLAVDPGDKTEFSPR
ncbi:hypothetical protein [Nocardiopsis kunsanensis]|uniref:hypothetical protein n=1 Tax=Nocardiopsis kunsanensis TaxID=141693 RepID=UPI00047717D9|nr:hypothetical protein [Nocardiopsis kunsanensis]